MPPQPRAPLQRAPQQRAPQPSPRPPRRVVVAPDKFKGTLTGAEAAASMAAGVRRVLPDAVVETFLLADGGEGTVDAVLASGGQARTCTAPGPLGVAVEARFALLGNTAVIEAAQASGLQLISPTPETSLRASSAGVGVLIREAWASGATRLIVGIGGVACTDGGVGMATELGVRFLDTDGAQVGSGELHRVVAVDRSGVDPRVAETVVIAATDVTNPLLGPTGAAAVYGPQKGAGQAEVATLEEGLTAVANAVEGVAVEGVAGTTAAARDLPGAGAAGGLGWGLVTFLGAQIQSGGQLVMDIVGLPAAVASADLVLTGEGRLDAQSAYGKGPVALAALAARHGVPTIAVAGAVDAAGREGPGFAALWSLVEELGANAALAETSASLTEVTARAVAAWHA